MFYDLYNAEFTSNVKINKKCYKYIIESDVNNIILFNNFNKCNKSCKLLNLNPKQYAEYFNKFRIKITGVISINSKLYPVLVENIIDNNNTIFFEVSLKDIIFRHMKIRKLPLGEFNAIFYLDGIRINFDKCLKPCVDYSNLLPKDLRDICLSKSEKCNLINKGEITIKKDNKKIVIENSSTRGYNAIINGKVLIQENKIVFNEINNFLMFQTYSCNNKKLNTRRNIYKTNPKSFLKGFDNENHNILININNQYFCNKIKKLKICNSKLIFYLCSNNIPQGIFNFINIFIDPILSATSCGNAYFDCSGNTQAPAGHYDWSTACCNYSSNDYGICTSELAGYACGGIGPVSSVCIGNRDSIDDSCNRGSTSYPVWSCCDCGSSGGPGGIRLCN